MKRILTKTAMLLLCVLVVFGATSVNVPYEEAEARTIFDIENELKEYQNMLSKLQKELNNILGNIDDLENKSGQTAELMIQYQAEIDLLESEIAVNQAIMDSYDLKRAETLGEIAMVREDYEYRISMYKKLMQFIYENGETNAFELLFSSDNIADYLTKRDNFNDIMNSANELIKKIEVSIADLEVLDAELAATQSKYEEHLTSLNKTVLDYETKIAQFKTIAAELNLDAEELSQEYKDKNATVQEVKAKIKKLEEERKQYYNSTAAFIWPVKTSSYTVTSQYGVRKDPFGKPTTEFHKGIDIACSKGTPIIAVKDGVVTKAEWYGGYGYCVIIYHGNGISSLYAHCDGASNGSKGKFEVKAGDSVKAGTVIAYVASTGRSTGNHLHFGVIDANNVHPQGGNYANPNKFLPDGYYTKKG